MIVKLDGNGPAAEAAVMTPNKPTTDQNYRAALRTAFNNGIGLYLSATDIQALFYEWNNTPDLPA